MSVAIRCNVLLRKAEENPLDFGFIPPDPETDSSIDNLSLSSHMAAIIGSNLTH